MSVGLSVAEFDGLIISMSAGFVGSRHEAHAGSPDEDEDADANLIVVFNIKGFTVVVIAFGNAIGPFINLIFFMEIILKFPFSSVA